MEEDDGTQVTLCEVSSGERVTFDFSGPTFDLEWSATEDDCKPSDYLYRFNLPDGSCVDSGHALAQLPRVGQHVLLKKMGSDGNLFIVDRVIDRSADPHSGSQRRCELWVFRVNSQE